MWWSFLNSRRVSKSHYVESHHCDSKYSQRQRILPGAVPLWAIGDRSNYGYYAFHYALSGIGLTRHGLTFLIEADI